MSNEFIREDRYIVFKLSDVERYLTDKDRANITMMKMEIDAGRDCANKPPFKGLIVEADWPEYEPTWKAIEARVTGAQNALEESAIQTAARIMNIELIRERDALRAKIEAMERQEPVMWANSSNINSSRINRERGGCGDQHTCSETQTTYHDTQLYALPKGRHMLGIVGTYGVDGYVPAQNAPSVPDGWKLVPIVSTDEMDNAGSEHCDGYLSTAQVVWDAMLTAAPEFKP